MEKFQTVITPKNKLFDLHLGELWRYRDLVVLLVRRTFVSQYKQTILGPAWAIIQPLLTTVVFTLVFGNIAGLAADGVPSFVFYLSATVLWTYFSNCLSQTANTFVSNSNVMGKVYFPRLVMPVSTVLSGLIMLAVQFAFFSDFRDLVSRPWAACAQRARPYDAAADFAACHALAWLRHYHLGADYKVQGSCHAGRLRPAALDVRNARRI